MIKKNIQNLEKYNLTSLIANSTMQEINGEVVCYLNLLIDNSSGEILNLSSKVTCKENAITMPIAVKMDGFLKKNPTYQLNLSSKKENLSANLRKILEESLEAFNKCLLTQSMKT